MWSDVRLLNVATFLLLVGLLVVVLTGVVQWAMRRSTFDLRAVTVVGADGGPLRHVNVVTVRATAVPELTGNLFTIDLAVARRAFEAMPWVRRAVISRRWPNRLVVEIEEQVPFATWGDGRGVNTHDELFSVNSAELEQYGDLPDLSGPIGSEAKVAQRYRDFRNWFAPIDLAPASVSLSTRYAWSVELTGKGRQVDVELGREQDDSTLEQRSRRLIDAWKPVLARLNGRPPQAVDLRYANGFAIRVADMKFLPAGSRPAAASH
jgi:cell division protein FtsQ